MQNKWADLYLHEIEEFGGIEEFVKIKVREKNPLIRRIIAKSQIGGNILEAGCGTGVISKYLASLGYNLTCIDRDKRMIALAKLIVNKQLSKPNFIVQDILNIHFPRKYFEVCFHHGVLEHFSDDEIVSILKQQLEVSKFVIFSVPTNFFHDEEKIYGDERFLSKKYWKNLISLAGGNLVDEFSYFHYSNSAKIIFLKLISFITFGKFPLIKPYGGFVIQNG